jgi:hypothetical protein
LELWEWPEGRILELSTKAGANVGPMTYAQLQELVTDPKAPTKPCDKARKLVGRQFRETPASIFYISSLQGLNDADQALLIESTHQDCPRSKCSISRKPAYH